ncbi:hypothetical protein NL365_28135, partial [Klebsiella pneumoniae]|nr:hypothetical protein [Klebsiella pneumoniae]
LSPPAQMVLHFVGEYVAAFLLRILIIYLVGIFCFTGAACRPPGSIRRLSFENPHHLFGGDFFCNEMK